MAFLKRRSRGSFKPLSSDRQAAIYLGQCPVEENTSLDQASPALDHLYRNYKDSKGQGQRVTVEVILNGLVINKIKGFSSPSDLLASGETSRTLLAACKMSFCAVDPARPKVFFIIKRSGSDVGDGANTISGNEYECHAFLCETPSSAKTLTLQLVDMFKNIGDGQSALAYKKSYEYALIRSQQQPREKGLLRSQSVNLPRSSRRQESVSVIKITMNVEVNHQGGFANETNKNAEIAGIIAKRDSEEFALSESLNVPVRDDEVDPVLGQPYQASSGDDRIDVSMGSGDRAEVERTHNRSIVTFSPDKSETSTKLLQLAAVLEQSPTSSPKHSPKERRMAEQKVEESKENQQVEEIPSDRANKRKSVRFAEDTEIIKVDQ